jgi:hypothetical protein
VEAGEGLEPDHVVGIPSVQNADHEKADKSRESGDEEQWGCKSVTDKCKE